MMLATGFRQALAILSKDLWIEGTSWVRWLGLVSFGILVLLLFSFAVGPNSVMLQKHAAGYLWLATLFASANLFTQSFYWKQKVVRWNSSNLRLFTRQHCSMERPWPTHYSCYW